MSLVDNPLALTGLLVMGGKSLGDAIVTAAELKQKQDYQNSLAEQYKANAYNLMQQGRMFQNMMPVFEEYQQRLGGNRNPALTPQAPMPEQPDMYGQQSMNDGITGFPQTNPMQSPQGSSIELSGEGQMLPPSLPQGQPDMNQGIVGVPQQPMMQPMQPDYAMPDAAQMERDMLMGGMMRSVPAMEGFGSGIQDVAKMKLDQANKQRDFSAQEKQRNLTAQNTLAESYGKQVEPNLGAIQDYQSANQLAAQNTGAADYQLIKMGVQAFDKRASAVTDEEFMQMAKTGAFGEQVKGMIGRYESGQRLTGSQRSDVLSTLQIRAKQADESIKKTDAGFQKRAKAFGVDFEPIKEGFSYDRSILEAPQPKAQAPSAVPPQLRDIGITPEKMEFYKRKYMGGR
jgi:hypothetical protein